MIKGLQNPGTHILQMPRCLTVPIGPGVLKYKNSAQAKKHGGIFFISIRSIAALDCGVGGFRTLVQTSNPAAFFTFSFRLVFVAEPAENHQPCTYPQLEFKTTSRPCGSYIYFFGVSGVAAVNQGFHETSQLPTW